MSTPPPGPIVIVGHTPVAWLLALWLKAHNQPVTIVAPQAEAREMPHLGHLCAASLADAPTAPLQASSLAQWPKWQQVLGAAAVLGGPTSLWDVTTSPALRPKLADEATLDALVGLQGRAVAADAENLPEPWPFAGKIVGGKHAQGLWAMAPGTAKTLEGLVRQAGVFVHAAPVAAVVLEGPLVRLHLANGAHVASPRVVWLADDGLHLVQNALGLGNLPMRWARGVAWSLTLPNPETPCPPTLLRLPQGHLSLTPLGPTQVHAVYDAWADAGHLTEAPPAPVVPEMDTPLAQALSRALGQWVPALQAAEAGPAASFWQALAPDYAPWLGRWPERGLWLGLGLGAWGDPLAAGVVASLGPSVAGAGLGTTPGQWLPNRYLSGLGTHLAAPSSLTPPPARMAPTAPVLLDVPDPAYSANVQQVAGLDPAYAETIQMVGKTVVKAGAVGQGSSPKGKVQVAGLAPGTS